MVLAVSVGLFFVVFIIILVAGRFESKRSQMIKELMLEGATLSNLPPLETLIADKFARDAIREHVVEIGFNGCVQVTHGKNSEHNIAEVFLIDDGGGVHMLKRVSANTRSMAPITRLETQAGELAQLLGVQLRT